MWRREQGSDKEKKLLDIWPVEEPDNYLQDINRTESNETLDVIRCNVTKGKPYGTVSWVDQIVTRFKLQSTLRNPGRPTKNGS